MPSRIVSTALAAVAAGTGLVALAAAPASAAGGISPASTAITATSTNVKFSGTLSGLPFSVTCASSTIKFVTPASGYGPVNLNPGTPGNPSFTGCKDNFGGTATITPSGVWTLSATGGASPTVTLTIPVAGVKFTTSTLPSCVVTAAPTAPAPITGPYSNTAHSMSVSATVPFSSSGCGAVSPTGTVSGTYVTSPAVTIT
ncbi:hypothetical protein DZF91_05195 [Actinomadura logoneensis]|uniref:Uncharacterized protein n=1 Tax=Actinomadura logoneensis TaxID=2293572 RepID=A0A372JRN1_9ACTN|nr:hypothetical protein [Actinomadura logoneensis]RFU42695.1 hypothetical protein DZF91_05195 [Actinomadura logoneensis]